MCVKGTVSPERRGHMALIFSPDMSVLSARQCIAVVNVLSVFRLSQTPSLAPEGRQYFFLFLNYSIGLE